MAKADDLKAKLGLDGTPIQHVPAAPPEIPDHEMIRCIGQGSYGEVWLARNAVGTWRAVKVVRRARFKDERPYEREFIGIQKYEPISRTNEGLVDVLQIGRNDAAGYFYYVMELADGLSVEGGMDKIASQQSSTALDPQVYVPMTLSLALKQRGRLPVEECIPLGLTLSLALGHLHRHELIHRDVKPSNIIFVNGVPKLADIGLVTELSEAQSFVGTEGFIPPEGPNSPQADLYALGKVLYEASMGKDRQEFPEPRSSLGMDADSQALMELNAVLLRACAINPKERYPTAEAMNADLALLHSGASVKDKHTLERRLKLARRVIVATVAVMVLGIVPYYLAIRESQRAKTEATRSRQVARFLTDMLEGVGPAVAKGRDTTMLQEILDKTARRIAKELKDQPDVQAELLLTMGYIYGELSQYTNALTATTEALNLRKRLYGDEHLAVAEALHYNGMALGELGRLAEAEIAEAEALRIRLKLLGKDNLETAISLNAVGNLLSDRGGIATAETMMNQALEIRRKLLGSEHAAVAKSIGSLALLLEQKGDFAGAEKRFRDALALQRRLPDVDELDITATLNNLSVVLRDRGDFAGAESELQKVLATRVRLLTTNHTLVADAFSNLANLEYGRGNLRGAEAYSREALAIHKRLLPPDHPQVSKTLCNLASVLEEQGDVDSAEVLFGEGLEMFRKKWGEEHTDVADALNNLAVIRLKKGDIAAAEDLMRKALAIQKKLLSEVHPHIARSLNNLSHVLASTGDLKGAEDRLREAIVMQEKLNGGKSPATANSVAALAQILQLQGKLPQAEEMMVDAVERFKKLDQDHPLVATASGDLAQILSERGKPVDAEVAAKQSLRIREKRIPNHWITAGSRSLVGACLLDQKRYDEAEPLLVAGYEGLNKQVKKSGPEGRELLMTTMKDLVRLYDETNRPAQADEWKQKLVDFERSATGQGQSSPQR